VILETAQVIFRIFWSANNTVYALYLLVYVVALHAIQIGWEVDDIQIATRCQLDLTCPIEFINSITESSHNLS
jgi:hypothetical protein